MAFLVALVMVGSCTLPAHTAQPGPATHARASSRTVGVTMLSLQYPFLVRLAGAMNAEAARKHVNLVLLDPRHDVATELDQVQNLITRGVDLITMIPVDEQSSQTAARKVDAAGIPLVLLNTRLSSGFTRTGGHYVTYVGANDVTAGRIQGEYLAKQLPDGGNVIYLVGQYGGASTDRRKAGFDAVLKRHPNIHVVAEVQAHGSRAEGRTITENLLHRYQTGQIQALVAQNDEMALGALSAIDAANRRGEFKVVMGVDGSPQGLAAVRRGDLTATVFQDAGAQGRALVDTVAKILDGQKVPSTVDIPFRLITRQNVNAVT
ncbi:sugar ABC transporter substrate-binding protein [Actinopolymorpha alba]|uniref:sugar ABC transporter substrate-binding protein n=1 Tax=Actinopolymorpha alba TaxID=533267 RepID=UPI0003602A07|nr:sugar ABC transporter substrate-binding protein [Actinopolymorpha alba]